MRYDNYTPNDFANVLDKFARGKQIHQHTFIADYTAENIFWSILGGLFQSAVYIVVYPVVFLVVSLIKLLNNQNH